MRSKAVISIFFTISLIITQFILPRRTYADVGIPSSPGGVITGGDKVTSIEMQSEKVHISIKKDEKDIFIYDLSWYAHVESEFIMNNRTQEDITIEVTFPFQAKPPFSTEFLNDDTTKNIRIKVNDEEVNYALETNNYKFNSKTSELLCASFSVTFKANTNTKIEVEYDTLLNTYPKSIYHYFEYILETGSNWKGSIGHGEIVIKFPSEITNRIFKEYNEFFKMTNDELLWEFKDLEPNASHNIKVSFAPRLFTYWESRQKQLKNISSSGDSNFDMYQFHGKNPEGYSLDEYFLGYQIEGNPVYLVSEDTKYINGWIAEMDKSPWVLYELDKDYKVLGIQIASGIGQEAISLTSLSPQMYYGFLPRPKTLKLEFSDGSSQIIEVPDNPGQIQNLTIDEVVTSYVKVTILDVYANYLNNLNYVGISRMRFNFKDEKEINVINTTTQNKENTLTSRKLKQNIIPIITILICSLILAIAIPAKIIIDKKSRIKSTESENVNESNLKSKQTKNLQ